MRRQFVQFHFSIIDVAGATIAVMGPLQHTFNCGLHMRRVRFPRHHGLAIQACITVHAWRTCRDACRGRCRYYRLMCNPQFYISVKRSKFTNQQQLIIKKTTSRYIFQGFSQCNATLIKLKIEELKKPPYNGCDYPSMLGLKVYPC